MADGHPTVADVAVLLAAYTKGRFGAEATGTFTTTTVPTATQVSAMIGKAERLVYADTGPFDAIPTVVQDLAMDVVSLRAAMFALQSKAPEQTVGDQSPYQVMREDFRDQLKTLISATREAVARAGDPVSGGGTLPRSNFPLPSGITTNGW